MGRKSTFSPEKGRKICQKIAEGLSLRKACEEIGGVAPSTVISWALDSKRADFAEHYARAMTIRAHGWAEEILEIADDGRNDFVERETKGKVSIVLDREHVQRSMLRVDSRKWILSKLLPKRFGDKPEEKEEGEKVRPTSITFTRGPTPPAHADE